MNVNLLPEILEKFLRNALKQVHTIKPAKVVSIDHSGNRLKAKILTDTYYPNDTNIPQPDVFDVPFFVLSANRGDAKITMPIAVDDLVLILFSDRDYETYLDTDGQSLVKCKNIKTHDYNPILALPSFYTPASATEVSSSDIAIENGSTTIKISPDGDININTSTAVNVTSPTSTFNGNVVVNGDMSVNGSVGSTGTITGDSDVVSGSISLKTHVHGGVDSGVSQTDPPQ